MDTQTPTLPPAGQPVHGVPLSWTAPSHFNHERSHRWYLIGGVIVVAVATFGILTGAWSVTLVSLLLGGVYFLVRREQTPLRQIRLERDGAEFEGSFTPWKQCKEFWLIQTPLFTELHITRAGLTKSEIRIQTADVDPVLIRSTLNQFLPMKTDQKEHLFDTIIRICKL